MTGPRVVLLHGIQSGPSTFWRVAADLETLGCAVTAPTLPGNAGRPALPGAPAPTVGGLADVVAAGLDATGGGAALVVGHSLGALVALALAARRPDLVAALVLEDPPCRAAVDIGAMEAELHDDALEARDEPDRLIARLLAEHPAWARADAEHVLRNRAAIDEHGVLGPLASPWDLPGLAAAVDVPITLLAATEDSALVGPDRAALLARADVALEVASGHGIHRDRPGVWTAAVLRAAAGAFPSGAGRPVP